MDYEREGSGKTWIRGERGQEKEGLSGVEHEREGSGKVWSMSERGQAKYGS
jgi:hypothetical protein